MHVFKYYLSNRIKIEKEIALLNDKLVFFKYKWGKVLDKLNIFCLFDFILYVHSTIFQLCGTVLPGFNQY